MEEEDDHPTVHHHRKHKKKKRATESMESEPPEQNMETKKKKKKRNQPEEQEPEIAEEEPNPNLPKKSIFKKKRESIETKMEVVRENPEKIAPLVGYFPSGFDPEKIGEAGVEVEVLRRKDRPHRLQLVVGAKGSSVRFVGSSHTGEAAATQPCTYALGVLDKETQTLKIVPIASNKILRLEPRVGGSNLHDMEPSEESKEEISTPLARTEKLRHLTLSYGTKKAKTRDKKLANLNRKEDAETQKVLDDKIGEVSVNKAGLETSVVHARNIPPHDSTADTPENAYPLDRIILEGEWDYLGDIVDLLQSEVKVTTDDYPTFVCNRIHKLQDIKDEEKRTTLAGIFSYIAHLITFRDQISIGPVSTRYGSTAKKKHHIPLILNKKYLSMFADGDKYNLSVEKKNLLISYILVLTLIADEYKTEASDIATDLKMTGVDLRDHYQNLGCKYKKEGKMLIYTLNVPLQFPKPKLQRRKR